MRGPWTSGPGRSPRLVVTAVQLVGQGARPGAEEETLDRPGMLQSLDNCCMSQWPNRVLSQQLSPKSTLSNTREPLSCRISFIRTAMTDYLRSAHMDITILMSQLRYDRAYRD